jgi:predicted deacetylase
MAKALVVSLHDAHPGSRAAIEEQIAFLAERGVAQTSILIVPEFHHGLPTGADPGFCQAATQWQAAGHELVLHGYFHDRLGAPRETLATLFWTRLYTNREAEFLDLPPAAARERLQRGLAFFAKQGWTARGFIAPAWLMTRTLPDLLRELGFTYTNRLGDLIPLAPDRKIIPAQSLCYSTRSAWRRFASAAWNRQLYGWVREGELVRLSLHPRDLEFPLLRRQIDQVVRASLKRGFEPTTYADYVAR